MSTFKGPKRGSDYRGKPTREVTWTYDSEESKPGDKDATMGVMLTVSHDGRRKQYEVTLQACGLDGPFYSIAFGFGGGGDARKVVSVTPAARFSEKKFAEIVDFIGPQAESMCANFHQSIVTPASVGGAA